MCGVLVCCGSDLRAKPGWAVKQWLPKSELAEAVGGVGLQQVERVASTLRPALHTVLLHVSIL